MPSVDWTISLGDLLMLGGGLLSVVVAFVMRETFLELKVSIKELTTVVSKLSDADTEKSKELRTLRDGLIQLGAETGVSLRMNRS